MQKVHPRASGVARWAVSGMPVHLFRGCTFPDAQKIKVRSLAKLVYCHMVNIAPTDLLVYVSSVSFCLKPLLVTVVMCTQSKIQEKHYALEPDIAHFFFCAVELRCKKPTAVFIMTDQPYYVAPNYDRALVHNTLE